MVGCILKSILLWAVMAFTGINIIGFFVTGVAGGILGYAPRDVIDNPSPDLIKQHARRCARFTVVSLILGVAYFYVLARYFHIGVVIAGALIMLGRLPDLIYSITHGNDTRMYPKSSLYMIGIGVIWLSLAITVYSLCSLQ